MKHQPLDLSIKLGEYSYQIIQQNFQRIIEQEKAIFEDKDPEPLHQMRVGMRRLRTAIQVFGSAIVLPKAVSNPTRFFTKSQRRYFAVETRCVGAH